MGLQGVKLLTRGYRRLQGVTRAYKRSQGVIFFSHVTRGPK